MLTFCAEAVRGMRSRNPIRTDAPQDRWTLIGIVPIRKGDGLDQGSGYARGSCAGALRDVSGLTEEPAKNGRVTNDRRICSETIAPVAGSHGGSEST